MENSTCNNRELWRRDRILGRGAFGIVEVWKNYENGETIAIKKSQLDIEKMTDRQFERWKDEIKIMNSIEHPNIVATRQIPLEFIREKPNCPILCMEYCTKGDLRMTLNRCENFCGLNERDTLIIMENIASAVEYLHEHRITHRDLKPENIVMQDSKNGTIYKLIDLGYAKELDNTSISASIVGTLNYLAPELLWKKKYSSSVDYWSLGILFYEIITGTRPFLPTMSINQTWMKYVLKKDYNHISIREIDERIEFFSTMEDPSSISQCLKEALLPWFRTVFHTDPSRRGKSMENGQSIVTVFTKLKLILTKKIIHLFYVCQYKKKAYEVEAEITIYGLQRIILERENIRIEDQVLVSSEGKILENSHQPIIELLKGASIIVFEKGKLLIDNPSDVNIPSDVLRMARSLLKNYNWQTIKRFYGATVFFMKQEVELFKSYIMSISIRMDLCHINGLALELKTKNILSESASLQEQIQQLSLILQSQIATVDSRENFQTLQRKINEFVNGARGIKKEVKIFEKLQKKRQQHFLSVNLISKLEELYYEALKEYQFHSLDAKNKLNNGKKMLKFYYDFMKERIEQLTSETVYAIAKNLLQTENELLKFEESLKSFESLLKKYQRDFYEFEKSKINFMALPKPLSDQSIIRDNIVLGHLITGILHEIEGLKIQFE